MDLTKTETYWLIRPEVPEDDGIPTGRYFGNIFRVVGEDIGGMPELADFPMDVPSKEFCCKRRALDFLKKNNGAICD